MKRTFVASLALTAVATASLATVGRLLRARDTAEREQHEPDRNRSHGILLGTADEPEPREAS
jgi:hypothetical protein